MTDRYSINVNGSSFDWDLKQAAYQFEGDEVVLFWINTAFKTFLDSIEEISGENAARLVLETAGYRTGEIVSDFYKRSIGKTEDILKSLPNTYVTAGWGKTTIDVLSYDECRAVVRIENGWEYKVNKAQGKTVEGSFLAGHWAGVLSGLFGKTVWYRVLKSQTSGDPYSEFEFSPSGITPQRNIRSLIQEQERADMLALEQSVAKRTADLVDLVKEISSPIIPVLDNIIVLAMIGRYDEARAEELLTKTLSNLPEYKATFLILDLTAISQVDEFTIDLLQKLVQASALLGTSCILVGISPELSMKIVSSRYQMQNIPCLSTLKHGIHYALAQEGLHISRK